VRDVFAWGDTLVHGDRTTAEDNAVMLVRFEDGRVATMDVSWSSKGGLENRFEMYGDGGRIVQDITSTVLRAFIEQPAGYLGEKVDADTGWVYPVPNETYVHGHDAMMAEVVEAFREGRAPRETFEDGLIVNTIIDAAYRSMKSGRWEAVEQFAAVTA
jgi:predicted dehydrogenase